MMEKSLAARLRLLRAQRGLSVKDAAEQLRVDRHTLRRIELGTQEAQYPTLAKIAKGYDVPVEDLLGELVPLGKAPYPGRAEKVASGAAATPLMDHPGVREWLIDHRHMSREDFLSWAGGLEGLEEVEKAIAELHETREALLKELRKPVVQNDLFGPAELEGLTGDDDRTREVFRPGEAARKLGWEIRREYGARENALVNYSRVLFIEGGAEDYLVRGPGGAHDQERHEQMLAARRRVLEEKYAAAAALV